MKSADDIKKFFKNAAINTNPEMDKTVLNKVLSVQEKTKSAAIKPKIRRTIMKSPITKLAAAAVVIVAVLFGIGHFSSLDRTALAFADILEQIRTFSPYAYTSTTQYEGKTDVTRRMMILSLTRRREVYPDGYIQIFDFSVEPCRMIAIHPNKKLVVEKIYPGQQPGNINVDFLRHMSAFENMPNLFTVEDLGIKQLEGRNVKGFHVLGENNDWTIWADIQTLLPIRIELVHPQIGRKIIMTEFEFDPEFDESLFSMTAPEGYTVKQIVDSTEEDMIEGLRAVAVFLGGEFPSDFELRPLQKILSEYIKQNNLSPSHDQMHSLGEKLSTATKFFTRLNRNKDYFNLSYVGGGVKLGDADTPILWYRPQGSRIYRIIYGNLSVKEIQPENLPK